MCRKPVWLELQRQAHLKLQAHVYSPVSAAEAQNILKSRKIGVASLRLLPKKSGAKAAEEHSGSCVIV